MTDEKEDPKMDDHNKDPCVKALILSLDIPDDRIDEIEDNGGEEYEYEGVTYFVGTAEEAEERCRDMIDEDMWKDAVANDRTMSGYDDWKDEVIEQDGFGQLINSYDGSEDTQNVSGTDYYIIRTG
jgi:hypothetical protein